MSESNQRIALIFTFVFAISAVRLWLGYNQFELSTDLTTAITAAGAAAGLAKFTEAKQ